LPNESKQLDPQLSEHRSHLDAEVRELG
jgi:hypothetical protein